MKIFLLCLLLCTLFQFNVYSQKRNSGQLTQQVKYSPPDGTTTVAQGTVTVTSAGFGKKKNITADDASASAIYILLFRGVPGSQYEQPMISDESKVADPAVQSLLNGGYSSFITQTLLMSEEKMTRKIDGIKGQIDLFSITINCDALRRYLEQNHVIRKFGI